MRLKLRFIAQFMSCLQLQVPFYEGEVITFDVIPTKLKFKVNYKSVVLKVRCLLLDRFYFVVLFLQSVIITFCRHLLKFTDFPSVVELLIWAR